MLVIVPVVWEEKHKNASHLKSKDLNSFIPSVQFFEAVEICENG